MEASPLLREQQMRTLAVITILTSSVVCQTTFGAQQTLTTNADRARSVYATDLDGDGDADVLSASRNDDKIAWYENLGGGTFGPQQLVASTADGAQTVYAADLDGDGDTDVISASSYHDKVARYDSFFRY